MSKIYLDNYSLVGPHLGKILKLEETSVEKVRF